MRKKPILLILFDLALGMALTSAAKANDPNLVGWWKFDEGSGTVAADSSGNGNNGVIEGAQWVDGYFGTALQFDGTNDAVRLGTGASLDGPTDFSVAAWIKTSLTAQGVIIQQRNGGFNGEYRLMVVAGGQLNLMIYGGGYQFSGLQTTITINDGQWHHVAAVREGQNGYLYIDGEQAASGSGTVRDLDGTIGVGIGADIRDSVSYFNGTLDDVRVYNKALLAAEVPYVMQGKVYPLARYPQPDDGAVYGQTWVNLRWTPGPFATSHDVYLSDNFNDVNDSTGDAFRGNVGVPRLLVGFQGYAYPGGLVPGTTYYWRIDEVNQTNPESPWKGDVWSFFVLPRTASNPQPADGSQYVLTDSTLSWTRGLQHQMSFLQLGTDPNTFGLGLEAGIPVSDPTFAPETMEPGTTYYWRVDQMNLLGEIHEGPVWSFTTVPGFEITDESLLGYWPMDFVDAPAIDASGHGLHGLLAQGTATWVNGVAGSAVELTDNAFFTTPAPVDVNTNTVTMTAWIKPAQNHGWTGIIFSRDSGAVSGLNLKGTNQLAYHWNDTADTFGFNSGLIVPVNEWSFVALAVEPDKATFYLNGPDISRQNLVSHAPEIFGRITLGGDRPSGARYVTGALDELRFYTRVLTAAEIGQVMAVGTVPATEPDPMVVESFDDYRAYWAESEPNVWDVWADGLGNVLNGSQAGHEPEPFMERVQTVGGHQSLPLYYNNLVSGVYSEISRGFSPAANLTTGGADTLVLWLRGVGANVAVDGVDLMYVAVNDGIATAKVIVAQPADLLSTTWQKLTIPLSDLTGVDITRIQGMSIGIGTPGSTLPGGSGNVYIDNIAVEVAPEE